MYIHLRLLINLNLIWVCEQLKLNSNLNFSRLPLWSSLTWSSSSWTHYLNESTTPTFSSIFINDTLAKPSLRHKNSTLISIYFPLVSLSPPNINIANCNNMFGFKLYQTLTKYKKMENIFISPFNLFSNLMIIYSSASSSTFQEMIQVLNLPKSKNIDQVESDFFLLLESLLDSICQSNNTLHLFNGLLVDEKLNIDSNLVKKISTQYRGHIERVKFSTDANFLMNWTNVLVNRSTHGLISKILTTPPNPMTKLLLINAIYLKGSWFETFNPGHTLNLNFHNYDGSTSQVPMMKKVSSFNYNCDYENYKICSIELFFSSQKLSFLIMIPEKGIKLENLETSLSSEMISQISNDLMETTLEFIMPKFTVRSNYELLKPLQNMGMVSVFSAQSADLSRMDPTRELFLKQVRHAATLEVSEEGTAAAGATLSEIGTRKRSQRLVIDRPFIFVIRDVSSELILFLGKVNAL